MVEFTSEVMWDWIFHFGKLLFGWCFVCFLFLFVSLIIQCLYNVLLRFSLSFGLSYDSLCLSSNLFILSSLLTF